MSFSRATSTVVHHKTVNSLTLYRLWWHYDVNYSGKKSTTLEMPVCAVRSEHNRNSSILCLHFCPSQKCSPRQWLLQQFSHALAHSQAGDRHQRTQGDRLEVALAVSGFPAGLLLSNLSTLSMLHGCHSATEGSHLSEWSLCILSHETKGQHDLETMFFSWKSLLEIIHIGP